MQRVKIAIVGGGASGIAAAISARAKGEDAVLCEKTPRLAKKVGASGNGRCNLSNDVLNESFYNRSSQNIVKSVFTKFGKDDIDRFFSGLGIITYSEDGRIFPVTNQAATVLKALEIELLRLKVPVLFDYDASHITSSSGTYTVTSRNGKKLICEKVILTTGGKSYPSFGSDGSGYRLAGHFGHSIIEPVPVCVPVAVKNELCHILQGQKIFASAKALVEGKVVAESQGDLIFTKYGLSGTAILDISRPLSIAVNRSRKEDAEVVVDMAPFIKTKSLAAEIARRSGYAHTHDEVLVGILPNKFGPALKKFLNLNDPDKTASLIKAMRFNVTGTRGWNEADFTAGGVDVNEVDEMSLESKFTHNLYFAGEVLDVDGIRGGYNLAWAWASGHVAGVTGEMK